MAILSNFSISPILNIEKIYLKVMMDDDTTYAASETGTVVWRE